MTHETLTARAARDDAMTTWKAAEVAAQAAARRVWTVDALDPQRAALQAARDATQAQYQAARAAYYAARDAYTAALAR